MKYIVRFNVPLNDPDGKPTPTTVGSLLARNIALIPALDAEKQLPILKLWGWQKSLQAGDDLELDRPDLDRLEALIPHLGLVVFAAAQALEIIVKAKDSGEK